MSSYKIEQELHSQFINDPLLLSMVGLNTIADELNENELREKHKIEKLI